MRIIGKNKFKNIKFTVIILLAAVCISGCSRNNKTNNEDAALGNQNVSDVSKENTSDENSADEGTEGGLNIRLAKEGELADDIVMKIGDTTLTYKEAMLYMLSQKEETEVLYGGDIWDFMLDDEGSTYEDKLKEKTLEDLIYLKIVCSKSAELNIYLSEDDKMDVDEYTMDYLMNFTESQMKEYKIDNLTVKKIYTDNVLANKIYESLTLNVDTSVSDEEAWQSVFYYIFLPKYSYDTSGNLVVFTEKELEDMKEYADEVYAKAQEGTDFYALAKTATYDSDEIEITAGYSDIISEFADIVFSLGEGEMTPILENASGYFIFYCKTKFDEDATYQKKEDIIIGRQQEIFMESYNKWRSEAEIIINYDLWESIHF